MEHKVRSQESEFRRSTVQVQEEMLNKIHTIPCTLYLNYWLLAYSTFMTTKAMSSF